MNHSLYNRRFIAMDDPDRLLRVFEYRKSGCLCLAIDSISHWLFDLLSIHYGIRQAIPEG